MGRGIVTPAGALGQALTACEEGAVRERAVESIHKITRGMSAER